MRRLLRRAYAHRNDAYSSPAGGAAAMTAIPAIAAALDKARLTDGVLAITAAPLGLS